MFQWNGDHMPSKGSALKYYAHIFSLSDKSIFLVVWMNLTRKCLGQIPFHNQGKKKDKKLCFTLENEANLWQCFFFLLNSYFIVLMTTRHILTQILIIIIQIIWSRYIAFLLNYIFLLNLGQQILPLCMLTIVLDRFTIQLKY